MKNFYGKTSKSTYFSALYRQILVRMQDFKPLVSVLKKRPLILPAALMLVCCRFCFCFESVFPALILCVLCVCVGLILMRNNIDRNSYVFTGVLLCCLLLYAGFSVSNRLNASKTNESGRFEVSVVSVSYDLAGNVDMVVKLDSGAYAKVNFYCENPSVIPGSSLVLFGKIIEPENAGNPGEFDYRNYLKSKGIIYIIKCERYEVLQTPEFPWDLSGKLQMFFFEFRRYMIEMISSSFDDDTYALAAAVCVGDKSLVNNIIKRDFQMSCCSHLLAVSGTHFSGFLACLPVVLNALKIKRKKAFIIHTVFCLFIGCLTGWGDSVTRAAFMSICSFALRDWVSAISLASMVMIISDPFCPMSSGFQMSFCACVAIKLFNGRIIEFLKKIHVGETFAGIISPCFSASLGMIPFWSDISMRPDLEHLGLQIAGSFLAQLACTFFIPCAFLCLLMPFWSQYLSSPLFVCLKFILQIVSVGSKISERGGITIHFSKSFLVVLAVAVFMFMLRPCFMRRLCLKLLCLILALMIGIEIYPYIQKPVCTVVFADVGQGDCCLIMTHESTCLIDAGTYDKGASTVRDILDYYGIYQVDVCVMSHWDVDHAGGIAALNDQGRVKSIYTSYVPQDGVTDKDVEEFFISTALSGSDREEYLSRLEPVIAGDIITLSERVYLEVLYPQESTGGGNEESLVVMLHIDADEDTEILFTGDIGMSTEEILINSDIDIDCDILKVAHHGSKYSSSDGFISCCSPDIAVISVGKNNFYGHPAPDTLERLEDYGCEVFRTDEEGAVILNYQV
ncbi:MAG: ComEC/Rec2 family competence protein [Clostridiales bacterium]|nr:ComEC/Rec2 family competence protein [Clostridiales bacterium]